MSVQSYFMPAPVPVDLTTVLGILRLSHKYDVPFLYRRALEHLAADGWYKTTFDQSVSHHIRVPPNPFIPPLRPLSVIASATEVGALWLLPWAYYTAAMYGSKMLSPLLDGEMRQHVGLCLSGVTQLLPAMVATDRFLELDYQCTTPDRCRGIRQAWLTDLFDELEDAFDSDPFSRGLESLTIEGMCQPCFTDAKKRHRDSLVRLWERLPGMFGLPPWDDLHQMKRVAMSEGGDGNMAP